MSYIMTSEAVTKGHPDKISDQIADAILYACLKEDPESHVACEVCCTTGVVILMGEITTKAIVDYKKIARDTLKSIGYTNVDYGIDYSSCSIIDMIDKQSSEINFAVNIPLESRAGSFIDDTKDMQGAGDQGIMFGYACTETEELMPLSIVLAHRLARELESAREKGVLKWLRPDGKTQVSLLHNNKGDVIGIDTILISTQHDPNPPKRMKELIIKHIIKPSLASLGVEDMYVKGKTKILVNPSGSFTIGGPHGDTGLTGRKLAVDTYGGHAKFGGGAMCGKDPSKVDRSAAYMARYIAKHIVSAGYASKCEVQLSYAIGVSKPVSVYVDAKDCVIPNDALTIIVKDIFDMTPRSIIDNFNLKNFDYRRISYRCQFGNPLCPWEVIEPEIISKLQNIKNSYMKSYTTV